MNHTILTLRLVTCGVTVAVSTMAAKAGNLAPPPGAVSPTFKTLSEVEPRIAINSTNTPGDADSVFKITQPGSYYLAASLTGESGKMGIEIAASGVTMDLNGFDLLGVAGSSDGVRATLASLRNIAVRNGSIRSWGGHGLFLNFGGLINCHVSNLMVSDNANSGITSGSGSNVSHCSAYSNGSFGISIESGSVVSNCTAFTNNISGIITSFAGMVYNCSSYDNDGDGITVGTGSTVMDCVARANTLNGISCSSSCMISGNLCTTNGNLGDGAGIRAGNNGSRIENNQCLFADRGIDIDGTTNYVADNIVRSNADNYDFAPGNCLNILISEIPETIDWPATVTLAGDLTGVAGQNGLTINADGVTIDLGGHALIGVPASVSAIGVPAARKNLAVRNGRIANWSSTGISAANTSSSVFTDLFVTANGASGILVGDGCNFERVTVDGNIGDGLIAGTNCVLSACVARSNTVRGLGASSGTVISDCAAISNGTIGINPDTNSVITHCSARSNGEDGIVGFSGSHISHCATGRNTLNGIRVTGSCLVLGNSCQGNGNGAGDGAGILASGNDNRIEGNNCIGADRGIDVDGTGNIIVRNTCSGNTTNNWDVVAGNVILVVNSTTAGAVIGNSGGTAPGSSDPNANFTY